MLRCPPAVKDKDAIDALASASLIVRGSTADEMRRSQRAEFERLGPVNMHIGFTADS